MGWDGMGYGGVNRVECTDHYRAHRMSVSEFLSVSE